ncbi:MAG TPA: response regulator [Caulobacteraceae bacterium]|nr:response regulator [Caulobacteraceae bacterium]
MLARMYSLARIVAGDGPSGENGLLAAVLAHLREAMLSTDADGRGRAIQRAHDLTLAAEMLRRAEASGLERRPRPQPLRPIMDRIEARWRERAAAAGAKLLVAFEGEPDIEAQVDAERVDQFMDALILHAIGGREGAVIEIAMTARKRADVVAIEIVARDDRLGRDPAYVEALIAGAAPIAEAGGAEAAIALALAKYIAAAIGGELSARANPGPGSTLVLNASLASGQVEAPAPEQIEHRGHLLIVDDNATNRMVVEALCEMFGWSAECACDGLEALAAARVGRFDAILMDIRMPHMDGVEAARAIRALEGEAAITPIIALTANADPDEVRSYLQAGMQGVVEKPVKPEKLLAALEEATGPEASHPAAAA